MLRHGTLQSVLLLFLALIECFVAAAEAPVDQAADAARAAVSNITRRSGVIADDALSKPLGLVTYVRNDIKAVHEFATMMYGSWKRVTSRNPDRKSKIDIIVFAHPDVLVELRSLCREFSIMDPATDPRIIQHHMQQIVRERQGNCWLVAFQMDDKALAERWHGYEYVAHTAFLAEPRAQMFLEQYGTLLQTDGDTFLSFEWPDNLPHKVTFGKQERKGLDAQRAVMTAATTVGVAVDPKQWTSHWGFTWFGAPHDLFPLAKVQLPILQYLLEQGYHRRGASGVARTSPDDMFVGYPEWRGNSAASAAAQIAAHAVFETFELDDRYDVRPDAEVAMKDVWHLHCHPGDREQLDKPEFLEDPKGYYFANSFKVKQGTPGFFAFNSAALSAHALDLIKDDPESSEASDESPSSPEASADHSDL